MDGTNITTGLGIDAADVIQAVRESAMLADVTISVWNAEKSDRKAMDELKTANGATGNVGRVVKNMLAGVDGKLKEVRSAFAQVRTLHYGLTLPWVSDPHAERQRGARLLPHLLFNRYLEALSKQRRAAYALRDEFLTEYPSIIAQAQVNLGGLADATYPSVDEISAAFRIHFDFEPLPAGAEFKGLPDHTIERLAMALQQKQERMIRTAQQSMWQEARERVSHIAEKLSDPEARFKASTVENVRELVELLPGWSLTGDERVDELVADVKTMLDGIDATVLRDHLGKREDTANKAKAIVDKLSRWGF